MAFLNRKYNLDGNSAPRWPFTLNKDSPQAQGLVSWWPGIIDPGNKRMVDLIGGRDMNMRAGVTRALNDFGGLVPDYLGSGNDSASNRNGTSDAVFEFNRNQNFWISAWTYASPGGATEIVVAYDLAAGGTRDLVHFRWISAGNMEALWGDVATNLNTIDSNNTYSGFGNRLVTFSHPGPGAVCTVWVNGTQDENTVTENADDWDCANDPDELTFGGLQATGGNSTNEMAGLIWDVRIGKGKTMTGPIVDHMYDPSTRWDLYYELGRKTYFIPAVAAAATSFPPWKIPISHLLAR